jgi:nitrite reductase/ring-hydroxylating ferredoxin subunit
VVCALPAALSGAADWSDTEGPSRRVGVVHAVVNSSALALYTGSWLARKRGRTGQGIALSWAGATFATVGGFLGGHLMAALGVGVDHTTFDERITEWTGAGALAALSEQPTRVDVNGTPVLLQRRDDEVRAIAAVCPHRGAPLDEGKVDADVVTCPWHGSQFCLLDGSLLAGPSPTPVDSYETRVRSGTVEIRSRV